MYEEFRKFMQNQMDKHPVEFWENHELYMQSLYATKALSENERRKEIELAR